MKPIYSENVIDVYNPSTGKIIGQVKKNTEENSKQAVDKAYEAFSSWSQRNAFERSEILIKWSQLIDQNKEQFAKLITEETGKPLTESLGEVDYGNNYIKWYAEEAKRIFGELVPASTNNKRLMVIKQPIGVVGAITPWNFPFATIARKIAPALATGCTVVCKPDHRTPLVAQELLDLAYKAGVPNDAAILLFGDPTDIVNPWLKDTRVRKITFTGSTGVGKHLMRESADTMKKLSLELGGNAPFIVLNDADINLSVKELVKSKFRNAGQTCVCANRIYVQNEVYEEFIEEFKKQVSELKIGDGFEDGVNIGPLIDEAAILKTERHIKDAVEKGAKIELGGNQLEGLFFQPTILLDVNEEMLCMKDENFGPIAPIAKFNTIDEVIERANSVDVGLASYLMTTSITNAITISEKLQYGIVGLNDGVPSTAQAPFGGWKDSGLGNEGGKWGMEHFLETKYISLTY